MVRLRAIPAQCLRSVREAVRCGFNLTEATAKNSAVAPILMVLNSHRGDTPPIPLNAGSLGCFDVLVRVLSILRRIFDP